MSKLFKFYEYLNLKQATQYLSALIEESLTIQALTDLINNKKIISYYLDYVYLTPIKIDSYDTITKIDFDSKDKIALYLYIPQIMSWLPYVTFEDNSTHIENAYFIKLDDNCCTLTSITEEYENIIYPVKTWINEKDATDDIHIKVKDIERLAELLNDSTHDLTKYAYNNIEVNYTSLNKQPLKLTFINNISNNDKDIQLTPAIFQEMQNNKLHTRERESVYKVIALLAAEAKFDLTQEYKIADILINQTAPNCGIENPHRNTIAKYLKSAAQFLPNKEQ